MKRFILFAFVFALGCLGKTCPPGQKLALLNNCCNLTQYWSNKNDECRPCKCHEFGAKGGKKGECSDWGWCYCKEGFKGPECDQCWYSSQKISNGVCCEKDYYYATWDNKCRYCDCTSFGAIGGRKGECDKDGWCYCKKGYAKSECQGCAKGYKMSNGYCCKKDNYYSKWHRRCRYCGCREHGSKGGRSGECDKNGACYCYAPFRGSECNRCKNGKKHPQCCNDDQFYNTSAYKCQDCGCHDGGSIGEHCDEKGDCQCRAGHTGLKCQGCISKYMMWGGQCIPKILYPYG